MGDESKDLDALPWQKIILKKNILDYFGPKSMTITMTMAIIGSPDESVKDETNL